METAAGAALLGKLQALDPEGLERLREALSGVRPERGAAPVPLPAAEPAALARLLLRRCRGDAEAALRRLEEAEAALRAASSHPQEKQKPSTCAEAGGSGKQSRREDPAGHHWRTDKCKLCPREEDPPEEVKPEVVGGPAGSQATYRVHLPKAGTFRCSETDLGFEVRAPVTVQYGYDSWDQHLAARSTPKWMVAGPLFSIRAEPAGAMAALHLPHFLCLRGADSSRMQIAHFIEAGMTLEKPTRVKPFHVVLQNPSFCLYGVVWENRPQPPVPVHAIVLLYWAFRMEKTTLHLYLIPNDHSRLKAVEDYEKKCPSRLVSTLLQTHKPLPFNSCYVVSSPSNIEVTPKELEFCNMEAECLQSYLEIYTKDIQAGLEFSVVEKVNREPIWEAHVRPEDATLSVSSAQTQTDEHFVHQH
ncbi:caspase recruitment domain-containing protein 8-like isoform X2 [Pelodiscus sinensis]|uniref:caspase recruitment domain-containing protein 8-like isoform X2 n=1 Tax=Pelodiscus sinensis TaxID=13735 RepID=UPI003F6B65B1